MPLIEGQHSTDGFYRRRLTVFIASPDLAITRQQTKTNMNLSTAEKRVVWKLLACLISELHGLSLDSFFLCSSVSKP